MTAIYILQPRIVPLPNGTLCSYTVSLSTIPRWLTVTFVMYAAV